MGGKIFLAARLLLELLELVLTLRPSKRGPRSCKVFGRPVFQGGPQTKHGQLQRACAGRWEAYSTLICLSAVRVPLPALRLLKLLGARIVVNQNGVYYPSWCPVGWERRNDFLRELNRLADRAYFQSQFSVDSFRQWVGEPPAGYRVLPNAVDRSRFHEDSGRATNCGRPRVLVFLDFKEINRPAWRYFADLAAHTKGYEWVFMGRMEHAPTLAEARAGLREVRAEWVLSPSPEAVPEVLRGTDVSLHFVYNDVCPNKVLECLASGVYVICSSAGGAKELLAHGGGEALDVKEGYGEPHFPEIASVRDALERFSLDADRKRAEARNASAHFDLAQWVEKMAGNT